MPFQQYPVTSSARIPSWLDIMKTHQQNWEHSRGKYVNNMPSIASMLGMETSMQMYPEQNVLGNFGWPSEELSHQYGLDGAYRLLGGVGDQQGHSGVTGEGLSQGQNVYTRLSNIDAPKAPPGVNIDDNINSAKSMNPWDLINKVRNRSEWDYKRYGSEFEDFGNFNYGATMKANGVPDWIIHRGAGAYHWISNATPPDTGNWWGEFPYGDEWKDQYEIAKGIKYANDNLQNIAPDVINDQLLPTGD